MADKPTYTEVLAHNTAVMEQSAAVMERLLEHLKDCPQENGALKRELEHTNERLEELVTRVEQYNAETKAARENFNECLAELKRIAAREEQWREDHAALHDDVINPKLASVDIWKGVNTMLSAVFAAIAGLIASAKQ